MAHTHAPPGGVSPRSSAALAYPGTVASDSRSLAMLSLRPWSVSCPVPTTPTPAPAPPAAARGGVRGSLVPAGGRPCASLWLWEVGDTSVLRGPTRASPPTCADRQAVVRVRYRTRIADDRGCTTPMWASGCVEWVEHAAQHSSMEVRIPPGHPHRPRCHCCPGPCPGHW